VKTLSLRTSFVYTVTVNVGSVHHAL